MARKKKASKKNKFETEKARQLAGRQKAIEDMQKKFGRK